jgi:multicomponent Na+:H+ antiporter subunit E
MWFAVVFLGKCFVAGIDVAMRAFGPRGAICPGFVEHRFTISEGAPRTLLTNVVSLLPGTMSAAVDGDVLRLHVLDTRLDVARDLAALERLVAGVFGAASMNADSPGDRFS